MVSRDQRVEPKGVTATAISTSAVVGSHGAGGWEHRAVRQRCVGGEEEGQCAGERERTSETMTGWFTQAEGFNASHVTWDLRVIRLFSCGNPQGACAWVTSRLRTQGHRTCAGERLAGPPSDLAGPPSYLGKRSDLVGADPARRSLRRGSVGGARHPGNHARGCARRCGGFHARSLVVVGAHDARRLRGVGGTNGSPCRRGGLGPMRGWMQQSSTRRISSRS